MKVKKGELLRELDTKKTLTVRDDFDEEKDIKPSSTFDFLATYTHRAGITSDGEELFSNRGLSLDEEGIVWERVLQEVV